MNRCEEVRAWMALYLDDELQGPDGFFVESHLEGCTSCAEAAAEERRLLAALRASRPLYRAPTSLRSRVQGIAEQVVSCEGARPEERGDAPHPRAAVSTRQGFRRGRALWAAVATAAVLIAGLWGLAEIAAVRVGPATSEFARVAVASHEGYVGGRLPLELASETPREISAWFDGKVPFHLELPNYQEFSIEHGALGTPSYRIEGARLVGFSGNYAAFVAYRMGEHPISLLVTSSARAAPSGGETVALRGLVFHHDTVAGLKVISWSHRGLTYALVSSLAEGGHNACMVCHQGTQDRDFIEHLPPAG